ncbi:alpha-L-fucosidase [Microbispora sp. NBRC 16548]|uniref:alpha-L-fucosidase n=1 Tax=Microbispora sp. NBRC 16548 TaxID=3030994 RepID=UPI0024A44DF8|nr:alpha-L-fucosidase [Microbispora sp. NBRC 16548]GLX11037.1 alpha-L-fucosidase [Microbispora sp. NBRC 16548]
MGLVRTLSAPRLLALGVAAVVLVPLAAAVPAGADTAPTPEPVQRYEATWNSVNQHTPSPEWFKDAKFGIYFHWGAFSTPAFGSEWYGRDMYRSGTGENNHHIETYGDPAEWGYDKFIDGGTDKNGNFVQFAPKLKSEGGKFDPDDWAKLFRDAGAKFSGPVAEHHDGFSMWDSQVNEWNSVDKGPKLDLLKLFSEAIRKQDMKLLVSMHHAFNYNGFYYPAPKQTDPSLQKLYGQLPREQEDQLWFDKLKEVVDEAQPDILWQDFSLNSPGWCHEATSPCKVDEQQRLNFLAYYYNKAQDWGKDVVTTFKHFDSGFNTNGQVADWERGGPADITTPYWLTDDAISSSSWSYTNGIRYYNSTQLLHSLIDRVSKNGNMLLNVSPTAEGEIPQGQRDVLLDIGAYLKQNGESIYSTRAWGVFGEGPTQMGGGTFSTPRAGTAKDIRFTRNKQDNVLYATVLGWPGDGATLDIATLGGKRMNLDQLDKVQLLGATPGSYVDVNYQQSADALRVTFPAQKPAESLAYVLKLTFDGEIPTPAPSDGAAVYEQAGYLGNSAVLKPGDYTTADLQKLGITANKIASMRIADGYQITAYPQDNFQGTPVTYTGDVPNAATVGSLRVGRDLSLPFVIQNVANSFAVDTGTPATAGASPQLRTVNGGVTQTWRVVDTGDGFVRLENPATGLVIDGAGGASGSFVKQSAWTGSQQQQFQLSVVSEGVYNILNRASGLALDSGGSVPEGSSLKQWRLDTSPNLRWRLNKAANADKTAPVTTATTDPAQPEGGSFTGPVTVTLKAVDETGGSGVAKTEYKLDGGDWTAYTEPVKVSGDGQHTLAYRSTDKAGNAEEAKTLTLTISTPATPTVKLTVTAASRCIGTSAYVAVTAVNNGDVPATITPTTPFGSKTVADVAPGKQAYQSFNTRAAHIDAGTATAKGTATIDGKQVTTSYDAAYTAASCS